MTFKKRNLIIATVSSVGVVILFIVLFIVGYNVGKNNADLPDYETADTIFISSFSSATPTDASYVGDYDELNEALESLSDKGITWNINYGMNNAGGRTITITIDYPGIN